MLSKTPILVADLDLPVVRGAAPLAQDLLSGLSVADVAATLSGPFASEAAMIAASFDTATLAFLSNQRELGLALQAEVLSQAQLFRVGPGPQAARRQRPLRVLGIAAPGDLQTNMPIEFIAANLPVQLDIVYVEANFGLPPRLPEHDVAFCMVSDLRPDILARLKLDLQNWPRPVLNDPARVLGGHTERLSREAIAELFTGSLTVQVPPAFSFDRVQIVAALAGGGLADLGKPLSWPLLVRPEGAHAGHLLRKLGNAAELGIYLDAVAAERLTLTDFVDYADADGQFRKRRIALIDGQPYLAHLAVSSDWMIHYASAGMFSNAAKRAEEAVAMADFDTGFAKRHAAALDEITAALGLDYMLIDCAQAPDGRLLLFEVELAAIIHNLDPADTFPYKQPQMSNIFKAFEHMLEAAAGVLVV